MQNLEQKFRCGNLAAAEVAARGLGAVDRGVLHQHDYFFSAPQARLKLRIVKTGAAESAELISYRRPNGEGIRVSDYRITRVSDAASLLTTLSHALGKPRELVKVRRLLIYKATRIHIDDVHGLGGFVELEAVLTGISEAEGRSQLKTIVAALGLTDAVAGAYLDLLP